MSMPFYVPAEQMMKDKADFARKGIARGRALVALAYADGIVICAENSSSTLRKVSARLLPMLFVLYIAAFLDRTNVSLAALQMNQDVGLSSAAAVLFFVGFGALALLFTRLMDRFSFFDS